MTMLTEQSAAKEQLTPHMKPFAAYDVYLNLLLNRFFWRCKKKHILQLYNKHISGNHLDIGVGSGYFLKLCQWPPFAKVALLDINPDNLSTANNRIKHLNPTRYQADIFKPQTFLKENFDSISITHVLHYLPGDMRSKTLAIKHCVQMLKPNGTLFGTTIISNKHYHTPFSQQLMTHYNDKNIYSNNNDTIQALKYALNCHLRLINIHVKGCIALFSGIK